MCHEEPCRFVAGQGPYLLTFSVNFKAPTASVIHRRTFKYFTPSAGVATVNSDICNSVPNIGKCGAIGIGNERTFVVNLPLDEKLPTVSMNVRMSLTNQINSMFQIKSPVYHVGYNDKSQVAYCFAFVMDIVHIKNEGLIGKAMSGVQSAANEAGIYGGLKDK